MQLDSKELKVKCQKRFSNFARVLQGEDWFDDNVHQWLCDWIQGSIEDELKDYKSGEDKVIKLAIIMPRGSLKTTFCTKMFPVWMNIQDLMPDGMAGNDLRTLVVSNSAPNARKKLDDIRSVYDSSEVFRGLYPELLPTRDCTWTSERATINRHTNFPDATYESAGTGTSKVGSHFNIIIEDDTTAPEKSEMSAELCVPSREEIDRSVGFHKSATPLLVPKGIRIRLIVSTRWAEDDLISYIQEKEDYRIFDIPALREDGSRVFSIFYSEETLKDLEVQVGPYMFSCLYLNKPIDADKRTFQKDWFIKGSKDKFLEGDPDKTFYTLAIDPAISDKDKACETAITCVLHKVKNKKSYQLWEKDVHGHFNPQEQVDKTLDLAEVHHDEVRAILVESNAYQAALKFYLNDAMIARGISVPIVPVIARVKKEMRIEGLVPYFSNGRVWFGPELTAQVESQLTQFPHGKLVDIIDCFCMHLKYQIGEGKVPQTPAKEAENPLSAESILSSIKAAKRAERAGHLNYKSMYKHHDSSGGLSSNTRVTQTIYDVETGRFVTRG